MAERMPFIGRQRELEQIRELMLARGTLQILCIRGVGGIGKTRLLQETASIAQAEEDLLVPQILDFDDPFLFTVREPTEEIALRLGRMYFERYFQELEEWRRMRFIGVSYEELETQRIRTQETFADCYAQLASQYRIVLLLDTVEKLQDDIEHWKETVDLIGKLQNTFVVLAGRREKETWWGEEARSALEKTLGKDIVRFLHLKGLSWPEEANQYFDQKKIGLWIGPELREKIHFLTEGRPIMIDLAVDWLARDLPLPELEAKTLEALKSLPEKEAKALRDRFEEALVQNVAGLIEKICWVILEMAYVYRRFDREILSFLTDFPSQEIDELVAELGNLSFVKSKPGGIYTLHDEMRYLVNEYVWPNFDPLGTQRQRLSQAMVNYYTPKVKEVKEKLAKAHTKLVQAIEKGEVETQKESSEEIEALGQEYKIIEGERLYYSLRANMDQGAAEFVAEFDWAKEHRPDTQEILVRELIRFEDERELDVENYDVDRRKVGYDIWRGADATARLRELQEKYPDEMVDILTWQAEYARRVGDVPRGIEYLERALRKAREDRKPKWVIGIIENDLGFFHRQTGRWDEAISHYDEALKRLEEAMWEEAARAKYIEIEAKIAETMNNLGYVYVLRGEWDGVTICQDALERRIALGQPLAIAMSYNTLGAVYWHRGEIGHALESYQDALHSFQLIGATEWMGKAYYGIGSAYWALGTIEKDAAKRRDALENARENLELSLEMQRREPASVYHGLGHVWWEMGDETRAREFFEKGYFEARRVHTAYEVVDSLLGLAELDCAQGHYERLSKYFNELKDYKGKGYYYPLFFGRMQRILGDQAYEEGRVNEALGYYYQALLLLTQQEGYAKYSFRNEFKRVMERIEQLPLRQALEAYESLIQFWRDNQLVWKHPEVVFQCKARRQVLRTKLLRGEASQ